MSCASYAVHLMLQNLYTALIASLLYISVCTRPQAVGALACRSTGQLLSYFTGTIDHGITKTPTSATNAGGLKGYCALSWNNEWWSAYCGTDAEYMVASSAVEDALSLRKVMAN